MNIWPFNRSPDASNVQIKEEVTPKRSFSSLFHWIVSKIKPTEPKRELSLGMGSSSCVEALRDEPALGSEGAPLMEADHGRFGKEKCERHSVVDELIRAKEEEKSALLQAMDKQEKVDPALVKRYERVNNQLAAANRHKGNWIPTIEYRANARKISPVYAKNNYLHGPVNSRTHWVERKDEAPLKVVRSGGFTDISNGKTNLVDTPHVDRKETVMSQALLHLQHLLEANQEALADSKSTFREIGEFTFVQISMLNLEKKPNVTKSGVTLNEKNQLLDMASIFDALKGKTLVFDGKGPFVDPEDPDKIHVNLDFDFELTLNPILFNVSTQLYTENKGIQEKINKEAFKEAENYLWKLRAQGIDRDLWPAQQQLVQYEKSNYDSALKLMHVFEGVAALGVNCFAGKDRTSYLMALFAKDQLAKTASEKEKEKLDRALMSEEGIARRVVFENCGHKVLKITKRHPIGMTTWERLKEYGKAALKALRP